MNVKRARTLRRAQTDAERKLWYLLRDRRFEGFKFRRQVPIGPYYADFICFEAKLVIEVDGGQHSVQAVRDAKRTERLAADGFRVIRFWNNELLENSEGVLASIGEAQASNQLPLSPLGRGRRAR